MNRRSNMFYVLSGPGLKLKTYYIFNAQIKNQSGESAASANTFIQKNKLFVISKPVSISIEYLKDGEVG